MATSNMPMKEGVYDTPGTSVGSQTDDVRTVLLNKISWGAVTAGVVVSLVAHLILNMIGIGVGASTVDVAAADTAASTIAPGALAAAIALLLGAVGGWFGGRAGAVDPVGTASSATTSAARGY
jgi:hypothetical protein